MSFIRRLFSNTQSEDARRREAERAIQHAQDQVERGRHDTAIKDLNRALELLADMPDIQDQERRGLCHIRLAEATLYRDGRPTYPPLSAHSARVILDHLDVAEAEIEPLLGTSMMSNSLELSYVQRNPDYPRGLIAMYRGAAVHFSTPGNAPERREAISYYEQASQLLDPASDDGAQVRKLLADTRASSELYGRRSPEPGTYRLPTLLNEPVRLIGLDGNPVAIGDESRPTVIFSTGKSHTRLVPPPDVTNVEYLTPDQIQAMEIPEFVAGWAKTSLATRANGPSSESLIRSIAHGSTKVNIQGQTFTLEAWGVHGALSNAVLQFHADARGLPDWIVAHLDEKYDYEAAHEAWMANAHEGESEGQEPSAGWSHQEHPYATTDAWSQDQFDLKMAAAFELETQGDLLGAVNQYEEIADNAAAGLRIVSAMLAINRMGLVHLALGNYYEAIGQFRHSIEYGDTVDEMVEHALLEDRSELGNEVRATASEGVSYLRTLQAAAYVGSARANFAIGNSETGYHLAQLGCDLAEQAGDEEWQKQAYSLMIGFRLYGPDFRG